MIITSLTMPFFHFTKASFFLLIIYYLFSENDETGVMDSLLEALQSGAAFRERRKRAPRPRGESCNNSLLVVEASTSVWRATDSISTEAD